MDNILNELREKGYRLTKPRKQILAALTFHPQSVVDIIRFLRKKKAPVDMTTIYRTLAVLLELGVVGKTKCYDNTTMFELLSEDHHHHLICNDCGSIEDISLDEHLLMDQVNHQTKFQVQNHSLEFFGLCTSCQ